MRIRLLNDGGYVDGFKNVSLPVEVNADMRDTLYYVSETELENVGANMDKFNDSEGPWWPFTKDEVEVLSS